MDLNNITEDIIRAAIAIHRELGPGLFESTYEACLAYGVETRPANQFQCAGIEGRHTPENSMTFLPSVFS